VGKRVRVLDRHRAHARLPDVGDQRVSGNLSGDRQEIGVGEGGRLAANDLAAIRRVIAESPAVPMRFPLPVAATLAQQRILRVQQRAVQ